MTFKKYVYGHRKAEIKALIRQKISYNNKLRYHERKIVEYKERIVVVKQQIFSIEEENKK